MTTVTTLTLADETYARVRDLAEQSGQSTSEYLQHAIEMYLDDVEDARMGEEALDRLARGDDEIVDPDDFWRGLAD